MADDLADEDHDLDDSQPWLDRLTRAERAFAQWQSVADRCDKAYASLDHLSQAGRDRELQIFWSNVQLIGPSIYAKTPEPVVEPKFKDRRPLTRTAAEFLQRCCEIAFDIDNVNQTLIAIRDDLVVVGRGVPWVELDDDKTIRIRRLNRRDFLHDPAEEWRQVEWVARRHWLTQREINEQFEGTDFVGETSSPDAYGMRAIRHKERYGVWEIWDKVEQEVVWAVTGHDRVLGRSVPPYELTGFFPCPRPAYATLQRDTLIPVPDYALYFDQLEEVNDYTARIHALAQAVKVRGFYSGGGDVGDAIERAMLIEDDRQILIPVPSSAALMQGSSQPIIWMPLEMVANTISGLIELRRQVIDDIYQVIGLADIMRGVVDANEKLGQSRLKQQNSSLRIEDKQNELVRVARDLVVICGELMAEHFEQETLVEMSQMELPTNAEIKKALKEAEQQAREEMEAAAEELASRPPMPPQPAAPGDAPAALPSPEEEQSRILAEWTARITEIAQQVTIDQVMELLRDERLRPFMLDIETDSTIFADEVEEKNSRGEVMAAFGHSLQTLEPLLRLGPESLGLFGGMLKFALAPYRVSREVEGMIDDLIERAPEIAQRAAEGEKEAEDEGLAAAQMALAEAEMAKVQSQTAANQATAELRQQELQLKAAEAQAQAQQDQQKFLLQVEETTSKIEETKARIEKIYADIQLASQKLGLEGRKQEADEAKDAVDAQLRQVDQAITVSKASSTSAREGESP